MSMLLAQSSTYYYEANPIFSFIWYGIGFVVLGAGIFAAIDANKYDDWVWQQSGQNKVLWMVLCIVLPLFCCCFIIGLIPVLIYFLSVKKKLDAIQSGGGGYGGGGYGGPGGYPPPAGGGGYPGGGYPPQSGGPGYPPPGGPQYPPQSGGPSYPQ